MSILQKTKKLQCLEGQVADGKDQCFLTNRTNIFHLKSYLKKIVQERTLKMDGRI